MIIFISGANRGIGLAQTQRFLQEGDTVLATFRDESSCADLRELQQQYPQNCFPIKGDVTSDNDVQSFAEQIRQHSNHIDILINNAGTDLESAEPGLEELSIEMLTDVYNINTLSMVRVCKALLPLLRASERGGVIVNTTSGMASMSYEVAAPRYGYRMSKVAVNMLSRVMAWEFGKEGLTTVAWSPGWVKTRMGGESATCTLEDAGRMSVEVIKSLNKEHNGKFVDISGDILEY